MYIWNSNSNSSTYSTPDFSTPDLSLPVHLEDSAFVQASPAMKLLIEINESLDYELRKQTVLSPTGVLNFDIDLEIDADSSFEANDLNASMDVLNSSFTDLIETKELYEANLFERNKLLEVLQETNSGMLIYVISMS